MSTKINTNNKIINRLPFCKVCQDSGKSEKIYTSHYVKDRSGNVSCPTLLAQECRYCLKKGHTTKYCKVLEEKNSGKAAAPTQKLAYTEPVKKPPAPATRFAYLEYSSDEEELEELEEENKEFPALISTDKISFSSEAKAPTKFSYANMAAKTVTEYKVEQTIKENKPTPMPIPIPEHVLKIKISTPCEIKPKAKFDWHNAESDSEGDEEEEEYYAKKLQPVFEDNSAW